jgi:DNA repair protein RadC
MDRDSASYTLIRDLPAADRPRERLRDFGPDSLSEAELLAILLRTGGSKESALAQAQRLLKDFHDLAGLRHAPFMELCGQKGIGEAKAAQIAAALELGVRLTRVDGKTNRAVNSPEDIAGPLVAEMSLFQEEHVRIMLLDARNRVLATPEVYVGSVHTSHVRIGELLSDALRVKAAAIVAIHNHPSGDPAPSPADVQMTKQLYDACRLMDIDLFDHIIIAGGRFASMHRLKLGFPPQ